MASKQGQARGGRAPAKKTAAGGSARKAAAKAPEKAPAARKAPAKAPSSIRTPPAAPAAETVAGDSGGPPARVPPPPSVRTRADRPARAGTRPSGNGMPSGEPPKAPPRTPDQGAPVRFKGLPAALPPGIPAALRPTTRADGAPADPLNIAGFLGPAKVYDLGKRRGAGEQPKELDAKADEVVVLELTDGDTLLTTASKLRQTLLRSHPELVDADGNIDFEKLGEIGIAGATRGGGVRGLLSKLFVFASGGVDGLIDAAKDLVADKAGSVATYGLSWAGTRALMKVIENQLPCQPGLYAWQHAFDRGEKDAAATDDSRREDKAAADRARAALADAAKRDQPVLIFVHGTGSSTHGGYKALVKEQGDLIAKLGAHFEGGVYAFEHHTLSESPIDNAIALLDALPKGLRVSFVTHSRGGLIADLLCAAELTADAIAAYRRQLPGLGGDATGRGRDQQLQLRAELDDAHAGQRGQLVTLAERLAAAGLVVERYVRVAAPARGTKLAGDNIDVFLSALVNLGRLAFGTSIVYQVLSRAVLQIVRNRTDAHVVPGIEAMLPDSPLAALLARIRPAGGLRMAVIAGDIQGSGLFRRLAVLLTDTLIFEQEDHDLVVDTEAMYRGIAPAAKARAHFDRGTDVSHFNYFRNAQTREALFDWLAAKEPEQVAAFDPLELDPGRRIARGGEAPADAPIVVVLPGVMGSHLRVGAKNRVWVDPLELANGGLAKLKWGQPGVEAEELLEMSYGDLCDHLARSHRVERFAYDWRQPLDVLGERLGQMLDTLLKANPGRPVRLLAHSMGGLVVRACILQRRGVMDELMQRPGARLVMLGTPHQGAHSMVENLLGKATMLRSLAIADLRHDLKELIDFVAGFRGALQLLPRPGFKDTFADEPNGFGKALDYSSTGTWTLQLAPCNRDFWAGDGIVPGFEGDALEAGSWLWRQDNGGKEPREAPPSLPAEYAAKSVYVFGIARNTPCGVRAVDGRLKMVGTTRGDGTVTWDSGRIGGIGKYFWMPAGHGKLLATEEHFDAIAELLATGATAALQSEEPKRRDGEADRPVVYEPGVPTAEPIVALSGGLLGGIDTPAVRAREGRPLTVEVRAMDLRCLGSQPILVGQYQQDPIAGPQKLIDEEMLDGELSQRYMLGLYPGPPGTASAVLQKPNAAEIARGTLRGAIVTGLGLYGAPLGLQQLVEAVRSGTLRFLLHVADVLGKEPRELRLASLLLGYNSTANLPLATSVEALVRGVLEANRQFRDATKLDIRVSELAIVEIYLDTAITAAYELRRIEAKLQPLAMESGSRLVVLREMRKHASARHRLFDGRGGGYWPRMIVSDADRLEAIANLGCTTASTPALLAPWPVDPAAASVAQAGLAGAPPAPAAPTARRLKFLYVGQRARAEAVILERQPKLIEQLVAQQIAETRWDKDFSRLLFQLMVPVEFKEATRQLERLVLVVDESTANLPWELMLADEESDGDASVPLAVQWPMVRQFETSKFRPRVRQSVQRFAMVIGNPSTQGFRPAFPPLTPSAAVASPGDGSLDPLAQAEKEAEAIATRLRASGYTVVPTIGKHWAAASVMARLFQRSYRIVHVSAHGVFARRHRDGLLRSGVVLSGGLLLTAAEFRAMEYAPELVFLNCCHLGTIDAGQSASTEAGGNLLAASVARELIASGVRCVIVAGWAVDDAMAALFGEHFYEQLLERRQSFGEAVWSARRAVWAAAQRSGSVDNTWGAFQAYGDPSWRAEPPADGLSASSGDEDFASPDELLDALARLRADLARRPGVLTPADRQAQVERVDALRKRCQPAWLSLPQVHAALGDVFADLGEMSRARDEYVKAVQAEQLDCVPMRALEQLANVESRLKGREAEDGAAAARALERLDALDRVVAPSFEPEATGPAPKETSTGRRRKGSAAATGPYAGTSERHGLRGAVKKRAVVALADEVLQPGPGRRDRADALRELRLGLGKARDAYARGESLGGVLAPYPALNRLWIDALLAEGTDGDASPPIELVRRCEAAANEAYRRSEDPFDAIMAPEARLVAALLDGSFGSPGDDGQRALEDRLRDYRESIDGILLTRRHIDSVVGQMTTMSRLYEALASESGSGETGARRKRSASRLLQMAEELLPGSGSRAKEGSKPSKVEDDKPGDA